jgi:hypothetical protein
MLPSLLGCSGSISETSIEASGDQMDDGGVPTDTNDPDPGELDSGAPNVAESDAAAGDGFDGSRPAVGRQGDLVPLFVAVGEEGRSAVSCDDGRSWVANRSDTDAPCSGSACDHSDSIPTALAHLDGRWFVTRGWGEDGPLQWSEDGERWNTAARDSFSGMAAGSDTVFAFGTQYTPPSASDDLGMTFAPRPSVPGISAHVRGAIYYADEKFWVIDDYGTIRFSRDRAHTWEAPSRVDGRCAYRPSSGGLTQPHQGGLAYGKGVVVLIHWLEGIVCRSTDHGKSFEYVTSFGSSPSTPVVFADDQFYVWTSGVLRRSDDGTNWSTEQTNAANLMPVARSDHGTWVAAAGAYESDQMLRSDDGLHWEVLDKQRYAQGHRMRRIAFGYGKKPSACD